LTPHVSITLLRTQTDQRLVELIAAGHDRAFEAIVDRYRRPLLRYARRFLHEDARAEDVVQSAFVSAWTALNEGATVRDLRPWLYRIVHNGALNVMKKPGRDDAVLIEASDLRPGPAAEVEQREDVRQALDTISRLPERQRTALLAVAFDGRSHADVGAELGLKEPAVRQLVSRARVSLRVAATAVTPWPVATWLAGIGGAQAGDTAGRVGEIVGGVGAGTVFGGGALKAGALVAAAGAVAVSAPRMAEVAHHHAHRPVATASAATATASGGHESARSAGSPATSPATAPTAASRFRVVSSASGGLTATVRSHGRAGGTSGGWGRSAPTTAPSGSWTHRKSGTGTSGDVAEPRSDAGTQSGADDNARVPSSTVRHRERHRSTETQDSSSEDAAVGETSHDGSGDSRVSGSAQTPLRTDREHHDSTEKTTFGGSDSQTSTEKPETPESGVSHESGDQPAQTPVPAPEH
jgi:RNA polymerase sigma factor (sigma-70 family)